MKIICDVWFLRLMHGRQFFVILGHLLPFKPLNNLENQNFEIWKNYLEISLYTCLINEDHMIYGPRDMEHDRQNFSSFWTIFCHFTPQQPGKLKFLKNTQTHGNTIILHKCAINDNHMMHGSSDMKCDRETFWSFWGIFYPFTPLTAQKIKIF